MIKVREQIQQRNNYSIQNEIIELNVTIMNVVHLALHHKYDEIKQMAQQFTTDVATLIYNIHGEEKFTEVLHSIANDVTTIVTIFASKDLSFACDMYAQDIGLNSESDINYTAMARCIATFGLLYRLDVEFDFE